MYKLCVLSAFFDKCIACKTIYALSALEFRRNEHGVQWLLLEYNMCITIIERWSIGIRWNSASKLLKTRNKTYHQRIIL